MSHEQVKIYKPCGHVHRSDEFATQYVLHVGQVCAAGVADVLCEQCCIVAGVITNECLTSHQSGSHCHG